MTEAFVVTSRFSRAVELLNSVANNKFLRLVQRVAEKLHLKGEKPFSDEELQKLQSALGLDSKEVDLVLETIEFILQQAAYYGMKPSVLQQQLERVCLSSDKAEAMANSWALHAKSTLEKLKKHSFAEKQLESVNWDMNLQLAQASKTRLKETNAVFHLNLSNNETGKTDELLLEFTHKELLDFYNKLEIIQNQLDSLS